MTSTEAKDVWRRCALSNGDSRTSRCTPASPLRYPNASSPTTCMVILRSPASSPGPCRAPLSRSRGFQGTSCTSARASSPSRRTPCRPRPRVCSGTRSPRRAARESVSLSSRLSTSATNLSIRAGELPGQLRVLAGELEEHALSLRPPRRARSTGLRTWLMLLSSLTSAFALLLVVPEARRGHPRLYLGLARALRIDVKATPSGTRTCPWQSRTLSGLSQRSQQHRRFLLKTGSRRAPQRPDTGQTHWKWRTRRPRCANCTRNIRAVNRVCGNEAVEKTARKVPLRQFVRPPSTLWRRQRPGMPFRSALRKGDVA